MGNRSLWSEFDGAGAPDGNVHIRPKRSDYQVHAFLGAQYLCTLPHNGDTSEYKRPGWNSASRAPVLSDLATWKVYEPTGFVRIPVTRTSIKIVSMEPHPTRCGPKREHPAKVAAHDVVEALQCLGVVL